MFPAAFAAAPLRDSGNGAVGTGDPTSRRSCPRAPSTPGRSSDCVATRPPF